MCDRDEQIAFLNRLDEKLRESASDPRAPKKCSPPAEQDVAVRVEIALPAVPTCGHFVAYSFADFLFEIGCREVRAARISAWPEPAGRKITIGLNAKVLL